MTVHPLFGRILRDWQGANLVRQEMSHFEEDTCQAERDMKWALSRYLICIGCDTPDQREVAQDIIEQALVTLGGPKWADIRRRLDEAGGDVGPRKFPTNEPDEAA